jgi:hypothetical protein
MHTFILILKILLAVIVILLVAAAFVKKEYSVVRTVAVNKPVSVVFDYLKHLNNQKQYSVWTMRDPNAKTETKGVDGTVGFIASWDSKNSQVGKGEQEIIGLDENKKIDIRLQFYKPFNCAASANFVTNDLGNKTEVAWTFNGIMPYPFNIMRVFTSIDKMIGKDLQDGLNNLKAILEK